MTNKKSVGFVLLSLSILLSVFFFQSTLVDLSSKVNLSILVGIAAIASGVSGVLMSWSSKKVATFEAIREYYQQGDTPSMIENRTKVYATEDGVTPLDIHAAAELCAFFHFWGMMVRKGFLPIWIFKSASGPSIVRLYRLLESYVLERRRTNNHYYAKDFEYLVVKIENRYKFSYHRPVINQDAPDSVEQTSSIDV